MKSNEIRASFLKYFGDRGHKILPSAPLIPHDDPTLLFNNAGMNQFKNVFVGLEERDYKTAVSSQKCIRAGGKHNDLDNIGFTARHHTFFEMLGNFSFGDYFKEETIAFAWEYITKTLGLDPSRLYATVYKDDDDAEKLWKKIAPELQDRVWRFDEKDNFWSMGDTGPCGPCSEIHYDRGERYPGELNGEGDRFIEIWNLVFMQYNRDESGKMTPLPKPSVDTGAGLERFCMILQNCETNYDTDLFTGLIEKISEISGVEYSKGDKGVSHRVIADHVRALTFAIADGGVISNEGRGYVLRRILRRASRHGRIIGLHEPFLFKVVSPLVELMGGHYPEIKSKQSHIELVLKSEEEQFGRTLDTGCEIFENIVKKTESSGSKTIPGEDLFKMYDTFGFPVDLTEVMAEERGFQVDMEGFEKELAKQKERSKDSSSFSGVLVFDGQLPESKFEPEATNSYINWSGELNNQKCLVLDRTPFYAESGGQIGDTGKLILEDIEILVKDTKKAGNSILHLVEDIKATSNDKNIVFSELKGKEVTAQIDEARRADIQRNHTATHLLHKALKEVLGDHVNQSGSLVADDRLRFDFTHPKGMTDEEIDKVEDIVRKRIEEDLPVEWFDKPIDEAKKMGAMALFGEKYGDIVRVVKTGDYSIELCGGTHVKNTADIGGFFILHETAIAAGMRRIEALTGSGLDNFLNEQNRLVSYIKESLKKKAGDLSEKEVLELKNILSQTHKRILRKEKIESEISGFIAQIDKHQKKQKKEARSKLLGEARTMKADLDICNGNLLAYIVPADDMPELMAFSDSFKASHTDSTVVTISRNTGGLAITSKDDNFKMDVFNEIKEISGARGGGKPTIRGSIPKDKIDSVMEGLKKRFG